jgi:hypothetical protein
MKATTVALTLLAPLEEEEYSPPFEAIDRGHLHHLLPKQEQPPVHQMPEDLTQEKGQALEMLSGRLSETEDRAV